MNKVILMGRLTRDPDIRYTNGDDPMCIARYTLAVDRMGPKKEGQTNADFIPCVAFKKQGEFIEKYAKKGTKLAVVGRIQTGSYTNRDGVKVYTTEVMIESQEFAESKGTGQQNNVSDNVGDNQSNVTTPQDAMDGFMNIPDGIDEELPFN